MRTNSQSSTPTLYKETDCTESIVRLQFHFYTQASLASYEVSEYPKNSFCKYSNCPMSKMKDKACESFHNKTVMREGERSEKTATYFIHGPGGKFAVIRRCSRTLTSP